MTLEPKNNADLQNILSKLDRLLDRFVGSMATAADVGTYRAFTWDGRRGSLDPVKRPVVIDPSDLLGIDRQRDLVFENTRRFVSGGKANNVLLWGERGTGKSSLIRSLLTALPGSPLRMVQVLKHDVLTIPGLSVQLGDHDACRFIVVIDDLSFEENQKDYQEMKTILDGGLSVMPENILFYATSNRKHLISTRFSDQDGDLVRPSDAIEEKVSLADRFGLRIGFYHFDQDAYLAVVDHYAARAGITMERSILHQEAVRWASDAGVRNGRVAEQFIRSLSAL